MIRHIPQFTRHDIPQLDAIDYNVVLDSEHPEVLGKLARQNIALLQDIMGPGISLEMLLPSTTLLHSERLVLRRTDDYYAVSVLEQRAKISKDGGSFRWDYLYYGDEALGHLAQVDITIENSLEQKTRLLKELGTVTMQRFMTINDHRQVHTLLTNLPF